MKSLIYSIILISVGCHCGADKNDFKQNQIQKQTTDSLKEESGAFSYPFSEKPQVFKLKKNKPTQIVTRKGVKIKISTSSLEHEDGSPVTGEVVLKVSEVFDKKDFVLQNCQTVSDGKLLVSGGSVNVQAFEGTRELQLKKDNTYQVEVPVKTKQPMELFEGTRDEMGNMNWKPIGEKLEVAENKPEPVVVEQPENITEVDTTQVTRERKFLDIHGSGRMSVEEFKSYTGLALGEPEDDFNTVPEKGSRKEARKQRRENRKKEKEAKLYYKPVEVGRMGWINIDAFIKDGRVTEGYRIRFHKGSPGMFGTYLIFNNLNSTISALSKSLVGEDDVWMNNQLPVGERVKIIIYTRKGDEIWHYKKDTVISSNLVIDPVFTKAPMADFQKIVTN